MTMQTTNLASTPTVDVQLLEDVILPNVFKPARYLGLEQGAYKKSFTKAAVSMAVVFPDLYEIGVSNYGLKLLYSLVNQQPDYMCDRGYAPAPDMKEKLTEYQMPLYGVETLVPLKEFDLLAFTLQYELNYTTILGLMEAAQIPFRSNDRDDSYPLLIAGGPGSGNPMPLSPFFDAFIIGDGEKVLLEILDTIHLSKKQGWDKPTLLMQLAQFQGVFIPGVTEKAEKCIVDIAENPVDIAPLIPAIQAVHDRVVIEARRGCDRMCRFCQPCFINLPVREQSIDQIKKSALAEISKTGYEECSLLSLSIADYSYFKPMIMDVTEALEEEGISLSLPSQRADRFSIDVAEAVQRIRKSTLTFAPEAGTKRLRDVINKNLTDAEILNAVTSAYKTGWNKVKLYFIIGLPTETLDDLDGIYATVKMLQEACEAIKRDKTLSIRKHLEINVTLSNFVPKPHTPFQWFPQDTMDMLYAKIKYLRDKFRGVRGVKLNFTDPEISKLEGVISKGGAELADVLELAYRNGAYLDAWDDIRNFQKWFDALETLGPSLGIESYESYTRDRCCDPDGPLPWDCIDVGLNKSWLKDEYEKAKAEAATVPCFEACSTCGVCANYSTWPKFTETPKDISKYEQARNESNKLKPMQEEDTNNPQIEAHKLKKQPVSKVRLKIQKLDQLKFISHLDWLRMIYRAVSRAKIPVAYSQGFNPKARISFSPALPLFSESVGEYVDLELVKAITDPIKDVLDKMNAYLPAGGKALEARIIPLRSPSIDKSIKTLSYRAIGKKTIISFKQATCQGDLKEYTEYDQSSPLDGQVADLQQKLSQKLAEKAALWVELPQKNTKKQITHQTAAATENAIDPPVAQTNPGLTDDHRKILNLTPYLENLTLKVLPDHRHDNPVAVEFRIRRLADSDQTPDQVSQDNAQKIQMGIKPAWVLNLIEPGLIEPVTWSLIRTDIELESEPSKL